MGNIVSKKDLYVEFLLDLYSAKVHELSALNFFIQKTTIHDLKKLIDNHIGEVRIQLLRLEEIIENHDTELFEEHCKTMFSMIEEACDMVDCCSDPLLRDFAITASL